MIDEMMRYINGGTPTPREVVEQKILSIFLRYDATTSGFGFWVAIE